MIDPVNQVSYFGEYAFSTGFVNRAQMQRLMELQTQTQSYIEKQEWLSANTAWNNLNIYALDQGGWFNPADIRRFGFPDFR